MQDASTLVSSALAPLWACAPYIALGMAGLFAFRTGMVRVRRASNGKGGLGTTAGFLMLACIALGSWALAGRAFVMQLRPAAAEPGAASGETAGAVETLSAVLEQFPPYSLAAAVVLLTLMFALLCPAAGPRDGTPPVGEPSRPASKPLDHLRQLKAELKGRKGEDAVIVTLARLGLPALHDVILRDGRGLTQVDHLVRLPGGIAVLETKTYAGLVTGEVHGKQWTQHLRSGCYPFQNPLLQNYRHVAAVMLAVGTGVPVQGLVVSAGAARFCPELEQVVLKLEDVAARLAGMPGPACGQVRMDAAWQVLTAAGARSPGLRGAHLEQVRGRSMAAG